MLVEIKELVCVVLSTMVAIPKLCRDNTMSHSVCISDYVYVSISSMSLSSVYVCMYVAILYA